jgi:hypothetical protein
MTQLRKHKILIYKFKRMFGQKVDFYVPVRSDHNILTGQIIREYDKITIKKAIVLPKTLDRSFVYDLAYIASNKNFTGGSYFDRNQRVMILDAKDLPKTLKLKIKMHIEFEDERFEIKTIETVAPKAAHIITLQSLSNADTVG